MNVIVHSAPRTGGFSVRYLFEQEMDIPCQHIHYISNRYYYAHKRHLWHLLDNTNRKDWKIVCTIRDPVARNLSEYWRLQHIDGPKKPRTEMRIKKGLSRKNGTHAEKFQAYIDHYRQHHFFGSELIPFWGIDVFNYGFRPPYTIYNDRLLVIRCEDLNEFGKEAIYQFTDLETSTPFPHKNVVPIKREAIPLSQVYVDAMYRDEWFPRFFYSEAEIEKMKSKWMQTTFIGAE